MKEEEMGSGMFRIISELVKHGIFDHYRSQNSVHVTSFTT